MTNEDAIVELRDLISDDRTDKENEALLIAIEALRENDKLHYEQTNEALSRAKLIEEWFDEGYNKAKETILGSMKDISTLDEAIRFFGKGEDFAQWRGWLSELKDMKEADNDKV